MNNKKASSRVLLQVDGHFEIDAFEGQTLWIAQAFGDLMLLLSQKVLRVVRESANK